MLLQPITFVIIIPAISRCRLLTSTKFFTVVCLLDKQTCAQTKLAKKNDKVCSNKQLVADGRNNYLFVLCRGNLRQGQTGRLPS